MGWAALRDYAREQRASGFVADWYPDPWDETRRRWWDGSTWTDRVLTADGTEETVAEIPSTAEQTTSRRSRRQREEQPPPVLRGRAIRWALAAYFGSFACAIAVGSFFVWIVGRGLVAGLAGAAALYGPFLFACHRVSRSVGSGDWRQDFGLRGRPTDLLRGFGALIVINVLGGLLVVIFASSGRLQGTNTAVLYDRRLDGAELVAFVVLGVLIAPVVEELFFRGLLLRACNSRMPGLAANVLQTVLFACAHIDPRSGLHNTEVLLRIGAAGFVLGRVATKHRRLGPTIAAHMMMNTFAVAYALAHR